MTTVDAPICYDCKHLNEKRQDKGFWECKAYPKGIPDEIMMSEVNHKKPYKGDKGIQFEPKED